MTTLLYLYGFVPNGSPSPPDGLVGIDGRPVRVEGLGRFAAAVSEVDASEYVTGALEAHLKDLAWVGERGIGHERVVTWFSDHSTIVPARLFTLFASRDSLVAGATERADAVDSGLQRFRDVREWDVKVSYDHESLAEHLSDLSPDAAAQEAELRQSTPGKRYLLERKREGAVRQQAADAARALAGGFLDALRAVADEVRELELPASPAEVPVVANAALLVRRDKHEELQRIARQQSAGLARRGVHASLTGPWAPYRFFGEGSGG